MTEIFRFRGAELPVYDKHHFIYSAGRGMFLKHSEMRIEPAGFDTSVDMGFEYTSRLNPGRYAFLLKSPSLKFRVCIQYTLGKGLYYLYVPIFEEDRFCLDLNLGTIPCRVDVTLDEYYD